MHFFRTIFFLLSVSACFFGKKMADNIKVVVLEADYAAIAGLHFSLQQAGLTLADAL
jgi:hypothetical protein